MRSKRDFGPIPTPKAAFQTTIQPEETEEQTMKDQVKSFLRSAGYSEQSVREGFEFADSIGYSDPDDLEQLTLSRILYTDSQLAAGALVRWEPMEESETC
jgi:hypothetical protein